MLERHAAERPKCVLRTDGERCEALAAKHRLGMLPGRISQHEVIEAMVQRLAGDVDAGSAMSVKSDSACCPGTWS
jgi:hypothetical protein